MHERDLCGDKMMFDGCCPGQPQKIPSRKGFSLLVVAHNFAAGATGDCFKDVGVDVLRDETDTTVSE